MPGARRVQPLTYAEALQRVRRYRPSDMLPALARLSAALDRQSPIKRVRSDGSDRPWAVSAIARDSLVCGNEWRSSVVNDQTLAGLMVDYTDAGDIPDNASISQVMTPLLHEQFLYGESPFEEMCRVYALMDAPGLGPSFDWTELFGLELREAVRASFILWAWVGMNDGRYDPALLDQANLQEVFARAAPREHIELVARALTTTPEEARRSAERAGRRASVIGSQRFNPLLARPLVDLGSAGIWAPQTMLVNRALHPGNLYYRGRQAWGPRFTKDLGERVEAYTGKQLGLIASSDRLSGELEYGPKKARKKSVDWFWRTDRATVLVECKSARMTLGAREGGAELTEVVGQSLGKARSQLDESARLIREQFGPFKRFDKDLPIVGLVVTAEPFYLANSRLPEYGAPSSIPSLVVSLRELEHWVTMTPEAALDKLLETLEHEQRKTWPFAQALDMKPGQVRNPILDEAWDQYAFTDLSSGFEQVP